MKYRKKPVAVEAWRWMFARRAERAWDDAPTWITDALGAWPHTGGIAFQPDHPDGPRLLIATREGLVVTRPGDWIVRDAAGEVYRVHVDIFEATYEPIPDGDD